MLFFSLGGFFSWSQVSGSEEHPKGGIGLHRNFEKFSPFAWSPLTVAVRAWDDRPSTAMCKIIDALGWNEGPRPRFWWWEACI